jgi:hypothetical protein
MNQKVVYIGPRAGIAVAAIAAMSSTETGLGQEISEGVNPVTEHDNLHFIGKALDPASFDPLPPDAVPLKIVPRRPDGAEDTKDA